MKQVVLIVLMLAVCCSAQVVLTVPPGGVLMPNVQTLSTDAGIFSCASGSTNSCQWVDYAGTAHAFGAGAGNLNNSGTPLIHQTGVFVDATHLKGITNGTTGQVWTATTGADPGWAAATGDTITSTNGTISIGGTSSATTLDVVSLTGDVTTSGANVASVVKVNGLAVPVSATLAGTNSLGQLVNASAAAISNNTSGTAANLSGTPALPSGTTATTQGAYTNNTTLATSAAVYAQNDVPLYSNPMTGVAMSTGTGVVTVGTGTGCTSGVCTMTTPSVDGTYRFVIQAVPTTAGVGCTAGTLRANIFYRDVDTGTTYTDASSLNIAFNGSGTLSVSLIPNALALTSGAINWKSVPIEFRAKAGTAIQYDINQTAASANCTTFPILTFRPALYGPLGY